MSSIPPTLAAVVFDWAGTLVDFGSHAPMGAFVKLFARHGVEISIAEARRPMGLPKWQHIEALLLQPRIADAWFGRHGRAADSNDIDRLYEEFTPMSAEAARDHATLIPGVLDLVAALRLRGLRIGSTTGYNRAVMAAVLPVAAAQGLAPDNLVCAGDVSENRPSPLGMYRCFLDLEVWPAWRVLKVDDTVPGLLEGRHAGCWTAGVTASGNAMGLSLAEWRALGDDERSDRVAVAAAELRVASPNFTVPSVAALLPVIDEIEDRLRRGIRPAG